MTDRISVSTPSFIMNKEFCINCGHKNLFEVSKPKFCAGCGSPFNTSSASVSRREVEEEEEREGPVSFDLKKLRAGIMAETQASKVSLDDLWKDPAPKDPNSYRAPSNDPSGKEILRKTMQECSKAKAAKEIDE